MLELYPGRKLGGHQLVRRLRGGEGRQVYAALDLPGERPAVVKVASLESADDVARLEREFAVLRQAAGPGVAAALGHAVDLPLGMSWLAVEAHGPSLASVLAAASEQRLATDVALAAAHAAAESLGELHARGWQHGDLKPGNLLCNRDGSVLLSDLEFARRQGDWPQGPLPDLPGTPPFVAPELWRDGGTAQSRAADIWALGVTLYVCLTGDYPFGRDGDRAIAEAIDRGPPPHLMQLPEPLRSLLLELLAREPGSRPADGRAAAWRIAKAAERLGIDLAEARQRFARLVQSMPESESPVEPGTLTPTPATGGLAPPPPSPVAAPPEPPSVNSAGPDSRTDVAPRQRDMTSPHPAQRPPGIGAAERLDIRPEGVGAADAGGGWLLRQREFLDVSSRLALPVPQPSAAVKPPSTIRVAPLPAASIPLPAAQALRPAPTLATAVAPAQAELTRRAAARWYRRMNPDRNFPLSVVFSGKQIRIVGGSGLGITLGKQEIVLDAADPILGVEPWFPGCLISPPRADVHVSQETTVCRFWVTPLVCGDLPEACVMIRYRGKVVETLATPAKVVKRTLAKALAVLGLVSPLANKVLHLAGWNPEDLLKESLPYVAEVLAGMNPLRTGLYFAVLLFVAALFYFYVTRPLLSESPEPSLLPARA